MSNEAYNARKRQILEEALCAEFARMGLSPCEECSSPASHGSLAWNVYHTPEHPCPRATPAEPAK